jgi:hypothetical protein
MSNYTLTQAEYKRLKTRLTTRINKMKKVQARAHYARPFPSAELKEQVVFEAKQVIAEADYALKIFEEKGSPDQWSNWELAKDDAQSLIRHYSPSW